MRAYQISHGSFRPIRIISENPETTIVNSNKNLIFVFNIKTSSELINYKTGEKTEAIIGIKQAIT